jgi:hypothetical protein
MGDSDLRSVIEDESLLRHALDLKFHVDRLCSDNTEVIAAELSAAVKALIALLAEHAYAENKQTADTEPQSAMNVEISEERRLMLAIQHARAHPSAARSPRVING